jgi:methanogenic corrinoid protein MtbC1
MARSSRIGAVNDLDETTSAGYPIGVVTRRTGLSPDVLRVWERRYSVVAPTRSSGGQRLYSAADIEKLRLLRRLVDGGHRIASVAKLDLPALTTLSREVETPSADVGGEETTTQQTVKSLLDATGKLDGASLETILRAAAMSLGTVTWVESVVGPFLQGVGNRWHEGTISPAHEHLATATTRDVLAWAIRSFRAGTDAPAILVATPAGELHELGALMAAAVASTAGWRVHYLGPNVPASDLVAAVRQVGASAVAISVVHPDHVSRALDELREMRRGIPATIPVIVGGKAALDAAAAVTQVGAAIAGDTPSFLAALSEATPAI